LPNTLETLAAEVEREVAAALDLARAGGEPAPCLTAKPPLHGREGDLPRPSRMNGSDVTAWGGHPPQTMREAICQTLRHHLQTDPRVFLYGQDIEDPKGDVFGVTRGLSSEFPGRVRNAPLSESTIVGTSIGRALAGGRPVAFLQFADFLPLAYNQILSEMASIHWRTDGAWHAPVIVMIACGGYKPGLGPFHAQTFESIAAHTPGVDVLMPSNAADAAGLLNAAFASGRPTLFFYPKACLNQVEAATSTDVADQFVPLGKARLVRSSNHSWGDLPRSSVCLSWGDLPRSSNSGDLGRSPHGITFVAWGNTVARCRQAADALAEAGVETELIDLRSLSPWDEAAVIESVERTRKLVVVHEDNRTCGFGAEVLATVMEKANIPVQARRVTRPDTFVPCHFGNQLEVLPSYRRVLAAACELLGLELTWQEEPVEEDGFQTLDAIASGPADETVIVTDLLVQPGDQVKVGDEVAMIEASKAAINISSTVSGMVDQVLVSAGDTVAVGRPLMRIRTADVHRKPITRERAGTPIIARQRPLGGGGGGCPVPEGGGGSFSPSAGRGWASVS
jgi:2-oxoisovalerate dehydrogenase E1 component